MTRRRAACCVALLFGVGVGGGCGDDPPALGKVTIEPPAQKPAPALPPARSSIWMTISGAAPTDVLADLVILTEELTEAGVVRSLIVEQPESSLLRVQLVGETLDKMRGVLRDNKVFAKVLKKGKLAGESSTAFAVVGDVAFQPAVCAIAIERFADRAVWRDELSRRAGLSSEDVAIAVAAVDDGKDDALGEVMVVGKSDEGLASHLASASWRRSVRAAGVVEPPTVRQCEIVGFR